MLGTSDGTFCPLSKLWCKSPQTEFFGLERERFLYKVELSNVQGVSAMTEVHDPEATR